MPPKRTSPSRAGVRGRHRPGVRRPLAGVGPSIWANKVSSTTASCAIGSAGSAEPTLIGSVRLRTTTPRSVSSGIRFSVSRTVPAQPVQGVDHDHIAPPGVPVVRRLPGHPPERGILGARRQEWTVSLPRRWNDDHVPHGVRASGNPNRTGLTGHDRQRTPADLQRSRSTFGLWDETSAHPDLGHRPAADPGLPVPGSEPQPARHPAPAARRLPQMLAEAHRTARAARPAEPHVSCESSSRPVHGEPLRLRRALPRGPAITPQLA